MILAMCYQKENQVLLFSKKKKNFAKYKKCKSYLNTGTSNNAILEPKNENNLKIINAIYLHLLLRS